MSAKKNQETAFTLNVTGRIINFLFDHMRAEWQMTENSTVSAENAIVSYWTRIYFLGERVILVKEGGIGFTLPRIDGILSCTIEAKQGVFILDPPSSRDPTWNLTRIAEGDSVKGVPPVDFGAASYYSGESIPIGGLVDSCDVCFNEDGTIVLYNHETPNDKQSMCYLNLIRMVELS